MKTYKAIIKTPRTKETTTKSFKTEREAWSFVKYCDSLGYIAYMRTTYGA